jgi:hypothetical protein
MKASSTTVMVDTAQKKELIGLLNAVATGTLFVVGLANPAMFATLFIVGFGVSTTLLFAELAVAPKDFDAKDFVTMKSATDAQLYLDAHANSNLAIAFKGAASKASTLISLYQLHHDFLSFYGSAVEATKLEAMRVELLEQAKKVKAELEPLKQSGNLRAFRLNELTLLKERLKVNTAGCVDGLP